MGTSLLPSPAVMAGPGTLKINTVGEIVFADETAAEILGCRPEELCGKRFSYLPVPASTALPALERQGGVSDAALLLSTHLTQRSRFHHLIGSHPLMQHLYELIELVAQTDVTVHICGESGVGKELVADAIHHLSTRNSARFVKLNCSSIPSTLLESTLFGHVKGAFTDAHRDQQGFIESAQGGTIFLDEIGEVSPDFQVKLLRLLQSREYSRVGEPLSRKADVRIITATNRDLRDLVERGKIREDFYYRVNVFPLGVPPLRNRRSDIPDLAKHFVEKCNIRFSRALEGISVDALQLLEQYDWPGNVRELENAIEHAFVMAHTGLIRPEHLPESLTRPLSPARSSRPAANVEQALLHRSMHRKMSPEEESVAIFTALQQSEGNKSKAASILGMSRVSLWKKLKRMEEPTP